MLRNSAPKPAHQRFGRDRLNWDDIRLFLEVARAGSFRRAAETSGVAANTLMRRIGSLERRLGYVLLARHTSGIEITAEGYDVLKVAERLQQEAASLEWMARGASYGLSGALKISVAEGLGTSGSYRVLSISGRSTRRSPSICIAICSRLI